MGIPGGAVAYPSLDPLSEEGSLLLPAPVHDAPAQLHLHSQGVRKPRHDVQDAADDLGSARLRDDSEVAAILSQHLDNVCEPPRGRIDLRQPIISNKKKHPRKTPLKHSIDAQIWTILVHCQFLDPKGLVINAVVL